MRNLQVVREAHVRSGGGGAAALKTARLFCVDSESGARRRLFFFCDGNRMFQAQLGLNEIQLCCDFAAEGLIPSSSENDSDTSKDDFQIAGVHYLFGQSSVCVASKTGEILVYNTLTDEVESVGTIQSGIATMSWSPDQDLVVFITGRDSLLLMTRDFEVILENPLHCEEFGESKPVTVGWGKKETQFHGTEGKNAAKKEIKVLKSVLDSDDRRVRVSWRGDGTLFATSAVTPISSIRQLRVWTREGALQYTSEYFEGLEHALSWIPSGTWIASSLRRGDGKLEIAFFEKNLLRHGGFPLTAQGQQAVKVNEVLWNAELTLLAVWMETLPSGQGESSKTSYLNVYSMGNYHWYLKQSFQYGGSDGNEVVSINFVQWDQEKAGDLHILTSDGTHSCYTLAFTTSCSLGDRETDAGLVYVVDGVNLLVTPFRELVIPPPMCAYSFTLDEPINHVVVGPKSRSNDFVAITSSYRMYFFRSVAEGVKEPFPAKRVLNCVGPLENHHQLIAISEICWPSIQCPIGQNIVLHHWIWINQTTLLFVRIGENNFTELYVVTVEIPSNESKFSVTARKIDAFVEDIFLISHSSNDTDALIQLVDGRVLRYNCETGLVSSWIVPASQTPLILPQPCAAVKVISCGVQEHVLALSDTFCLYLDSIQLSDKCTSFSSNVNFILYATFDHHLHSLPISALANGVSDEKLLNTCTDKRLIERGSRIVAAVPKDLKVILQMPRGNLEAIYPRALVLHAVRESLDRIEFKKALVIVRKHRIDMNILYDHNPKMFRENVDKFVQQVDDVILINLFLSSLRDEDLTRTMYEAIYSMSNQSEAPNPVVGKVNLVCDIVRVQLEKANQNKYVLAILTAHAAKKEPELELALLKIMELKDKGAQHNNVITPDVALRHLLYLVDVSKLYNVALGTYDFDLVLMVAEKSQKDPKEFLPFLNNLKLLESNYQKYSIDVYLKRYTKALKHISKCGEDRFDECIAFIEQHHLYTHALNLFQRGTKPWKAIVSAQARHLLANNHLEEAGLTYFVGDFLQEALQVFKRCGNWRRAFCVAHKLNLATPEIVMLAHHFSDQLKSNGRHVEAAEILETFAKDCEESIKALIEAQSWDSALLVMNRHCRLDMIDSHLTPALVSRAAAMIVTLDQESARFEERKSRLLAVRDELEKRRQKLNDDCLTGDADMFSETSTVTGASSSGQSCTTGTGSRFTSKTSRSKKKAERKKVSLKEGSLFEDIALLEVLTEIIKRVDSMKEECSNLVQALILHHFPKEATQVQDKLELFIKHVIASKSTIWPPDDDPDVQELSTNSMKFGPMSTANSLAMQAARSPGMTGRRNIPHDCEL